MLVENSKAKQTNTTQTAPNNIWQDILREAMTKKDLEESNVFIFGDKFAGKRSLIKIINKELLQKGEVEEQKKILGTDEGVSKYGLLDYTYLNIKKISEQDAESIGKMNIWIANDMISREIFESIIKPEFILKSLCMIVLDLSRVSGLNFLLIDIIFQPWEILESLKKWTNFIYDTFSTMMLKFPFEKQQELRDSIVEYLKLYEEPQFDEEGNFKKEQLSEENINLKLQLQLKEGLLKTNIGVPLVIVVNKSDIVMQTGERKKFEEDSEFILKHIRNFALIYGATIIYSSSKQNTNLNVIYEYILHRIYKFDLRHRPNLMDRDSYFVPAGYDSISTLKSFDIQNELSMLYEERVPYVKPKNVIKEEEIACEDSNAFLKRFISSTKKPEPTSRRNISEHAYSTEDSKSLLEEKLNITRNLSEKDSAVTENYTSNGKSVNFEIFKNQQGKLSSMDVSATGAKPTSTAERLEAIKKNHERLLINNDKNTDKTEKNEKYEKTRENVLKRLNQFRKENTNK